MKEDVKKELEALAANGNLTCANARGLAERLGVPYAEVGQAANALHIKIEGCELGCF